MYLAETVSYDNIFWKCQPLHFFSFILKCIYLGTYVIAYFNACLQISDTEICCLVAGDVEVVFLYQYLVQKNITKGKF